MKDGQLVRYIVHADRRIARLHDKTGRPAGAPTTLGGDTAPTVDAPLSSGDIVATRDWDVMGLFGWLAALATLGGALFGGALFGARRRQRALAWAAALGPRFANALGALLLAASFASLTSCSGAPTSGAPPPIEEGTIRGLSDADTLLFHDQLGSLLTETSGTGEVQTRFAAYPYGATRHQSSTESRLYANAPRDTGVGLDHMGARFYAPDLGAWTIGDPILLNAPEAVATGEFATANPYAYANLNPVVAVDSDGNFWHIAAGAGIGALVGGGVEAARQYAVHGKVTDWGRLRAAAAGGAVSGAVTAAVPAAGLASIMAVGAGSNVTAGVTQRLVESGGRDAGTLKDVAIDAGVGAVTGGLLKGGAALVKRMAPAKPLPVTPAPQSTAPSATAIVRYDGEFATRQLLGRDPTTSGGRTIMAHAAERMVHPPRGRAAMSMAEVDRVLDTADKIRKVSPHPNGATITVQSTTMPGKPQVIVDAATGKKVITVVKNAQ